MFPVFLHLSAKAQFEVNSASLIGEQQRNDPIAEQDDEAKMLANNATPVPGEDASITAEEAKGKNIARQTVLFDTAQKLNSVDPAFNNDPFKIDYLNDNDLEAFRSDLDLVRYYSINRFPTLVINSKGKSLIIAGYRHLLK